MNTNEAVNHVLLSLILLRNISVDLHDSVCELINYFSTILLLLLSH